MSDLVPVSGIVEKCLELNLYAVALCSNHFLYLGLNKIIERGHMLLHETQKMW